VGVYLEFPTDPIEYLYRVQAWEKVPFSDYHASQYSARFAPFVYHWLLRATEVGVGDRTSLSVLTGIIQAMLLWAVIRLGLVLTGSVGWGCLAALLALGYFGYDAISYFRYLPLSGAILSHIAFLEGLVLVVAALTREQWRYLALLPPLVLLAWWNHEQGVLFFANALLGSGLLLLIFRYRTLDPRFRRRLLLSTIGLAAITVIVALGRGPGSWNSPPLPSYVTRLGVVFGQPLYAHAFAMLDQMMGLVGWVSMLLAVAVLVTRTSDRRLDVAAAVSLWPLLVVWNPAALFFLDRILPWESFHRLLYGSVYWLLPAVVLKHLSDRIGEAGARSARAGLFGRVSVALVLILVAISFVPGPPVRGRMRHLWDRVDPRLDGSTLKRTIEFVRARAPQECPDPHPDPRFQPIRHYVLTDPYVSAYLAATGYFYVAIDRWGGPGWESPPLDFTVSHNGHIDYPTFRSILRHRGVCYVIVYRQQAPLWSWMGATTHHWAPDAARAEQYYSPRFLEWIRRHPDDFELVFRDGPIGVYRPR
jgi:hypothetical protein